MKTKMDMQLDTSIQVPGPNKWLILAVSLTHLAESRDPFLLEVEIVHNIFSMGYTEKCVADKKL